MEEIQFNHTLPIQLRFNDVDKFGHVNNTVYFSFYDLGKTEYFASVCPDVAQYTPLYQEIAMETPSTTDAETYAWLGDIPGMREWIGDREVQNLIGSDYTIKNKTWELTFGIPREAVEDDKIGLYNPSVESMGQEAATHPDELVFRLLKDGFSAPCYDGKPFFSDARPVG